MDGHAGVAATTEERERLVELGEAVASQRRHVDYVEALERDDRAMVEVRARARHGLRRLSSRYEAAIAAFAERAGVPVDDAREEARQLVADASVERDTAAALGIVYEMFSLAGNRAVGELVDRLCDDVAAGRRDADGAAQGLRDGLAAVADDYPEATDTAVCEAAWQPVRAALVAAGVDPGPVER